MVIEVIEQIAIVLAFLVACTVIENAFIGGRR